MMTSASFEFDSTVDTVWFQLRLGDSATSYTGAIDMIYVVDDVQANLTKALVILALHPRPCKITITSVVGG